MYHWISVLNRFDDVLQSFINAYHLGDGPQTIPFARTVLLESCTSSGISSSDAQSTLNALGFGDEGDRELIESILEFSRVLMEKCGNRTLYSSSERINDILNTTSLSLLQTALRLGICLAQRYYLRQRSSGSSHFHQSQLISHYNIELERVQKLASPFPRPVPIGRFSQGFSSKSKQKASYGSRKGSNGKCNANDVISLVKNVKEDGDVNGPSVVDWEEWGNVWMTTYPSPSKAEKEKAGVETEQPPATPSASTPQRSSTYPTPRQGRQVPEDPASAARAENDDSRAMAVLEISSSEISSRPLEEILKSRLKEIPDESAYELLNRLRTARALVESSESRRQILSIRMLAITNLAYIYPESMLQQKVFHLDADEPRRLQLTHQLAELIHLGGTGVIPTSLLQQTVALDTLTALAKHRLRSPEVCSALNVNVNHGILMFVLRKALGDLEVEDEDDGVVSNQADEWRNSLFALLRALPNCGVRVPESLVSAGLITIFVDILNLRTEKARRVQPRVIEFLDNFVHSVRDSLSILATSKGFDAVSGLISSDTKTSFDLVARGQGFPADFATQAVDYKIPYFYQQSLRWLFKFVNHVMQHNGGGFERIIRNLIDSPPLLTALKLVIENAKTFGSHVWSGAVNILSNFIHNEPTSYAVIAEAGLSKSFLRAIMGEALGVSEDDMQTSEVASPPSPEFSSGPIGEIPRTKEALGPLLSRPADRKFAEGILPSTDAIICIPQAFGAICLHSTGLELFQKSKALERFFDIFESPEHVKCMKGDSNVVRLLGNSFDELVRHHPALKRAIMTSVLLMTARVSLKCKSKAWNSGLGAKLWVDGPEGKPSVAGGLQSLVEDVGSPSGVKDFHNGLIYDNYPIDPAEPDTSNEEDSNGLTVANYMFVALRFLGAFFENQSICSNFIESGGAEYVLDFATLQSLPFDFHTSEACSYLAQVVHQMVDLKPHLILPSLLDRTQDAVNMLEPFWRSSSPTGFFATLTTTVGNADDNVESTEIRDKGTFFVKHLVAVHTLTDILRESFVPPIYPSRSSSQMSPFLHANLADKYEKLVEGFGLLRAACVWEEIQVYRRIPESWNQATKASGAGGNLEASETSLASEDNAQPRAENREEASVDRSFTETASGEPSTDTDSSKDPQPSSASPAFRNVKALRYLLGSLPTSVTRFFRVLGHALIPKRRLDQYQRQKATQVADAVASMMLQQLRVDAPQKSPHVKDRFSYLIVILSTFPALFFDNASEPPHCLTIILASFMKLGGIQTLKDIADMFLNEIFALEPQNESRETTQASQNDVPDASARLASAYGGLKFIVNFFSQVTSAHLVNDSPQTKAMINENRDRPDYFSSAQFLVELRNEVLPKVQEMWNSKFIETANSSIIRSLISILRHILDSECEAGAFHRGQNVPQQNLVAPKRFPLGSDRVNSLKSKGYDEDLVREALYRCDNFVVAAEEYCETQRGFRAPPRIPPPVDDVVNTGTVGPSSDQSPTEFDPLRTLLNQVRAGRTTISVDETSPSETDSQAGRPIMTAPFSQSSGEAQGEPSSSASGLITDNQSQTEEPQPHENPESPTSGASREVVTVEDLDEARDTVRENLIERCLEVLNSHHDITFELADLILSAARTANDSDAFRREVAEILLPSLVSLQMEENFQLEGKKIAAYANLLAVLLQDQTIYESTLEELKSNFSTLVGFIKISSPVTEKQGDESYPWIGQVLAIMERVLSDDEKPRQIQYTRPNSLDDFKPDNTENKEENNESVMPLDQRVKLLEAILDILPRIGKSQSLALSVTRILVILTRDQSISNRLGEKRNLQRLFLMIKQVASASNDKLFSSFMIILRHVIEEEDMIRQIMRGDITSYFDTRAPRYHDVSSYARHLYPQALRNPELFVEATGEKLKLQRWDRQILSQKSETTDSPRFSLTGTNNAQQGSSSTEKEQQAPPESPEPKEKQKPFELRTPVVEHPDGVIHYLLSELFFYRDVDDKPPSEPTKTNKLDFQPQADATSGRNSPTSADQTASGPKKPEKPQFKAEEHPIYIYRCFLLQCLNELLSSYNNTKVEFINFSRKADPLTITPSKPRSGILNYLLHSLVPVGTLEHDESIAFKKKLNTSQCAIGAIVSLCASTGENGRQRSDDDGEPELVFVRKFVLEQGLKAFKDANQSQEPLDVKYARLLSLADLFDKMLPGSPAPDGVFQFHSSTRPIAKMMFEKNYIPTLTSSIADIDLNFPSAKRAVKYILHPLDKLTQIAVALSETSSISTTLGQTDEDEISSATSVSDYENDREETPDLFRHSTLGMFEANQEEMSSSEESEREDDDMYDDEYDDDMEYDEELPEDDGEVVSDEDEDDERGPIEGLPGDAGMDIEVLIDDDHGGEGGERDEDDEGDEDEGEELVVSGDASGDDYDEDGEEEEWESEEMTDGDEEEEMMNQLEDDLEDYAQGDNADQGAYSGLLRVLEDANGPVGRMGSDIDHEEELDDDMPEDEEGLCNAISYLWYI